MENKKAKALTTREELPESAKWRPEHIYATLADWEADFTWAGEQIPALEAAIDHLKEGKEAVLAALKLEAEIGERLSRMVTYCTCMLNTDNGVPENQALMLRMEGLYTRISAAASRLSPALLKLPKAELKVYMKDPDFADFDETLRQLDRSRAHILSASEEKLLAAGREALRSSSNVYDMLTDVDMKLGAVKDEEGNTVELTNARYGTMMESKDRRVRKGAFERMLKAYGAYGNTFAALYAGNVKADVFAARSRKYASALEAALDPDEVPVSVYRSLIEAVHDALPVLKAYCAMRKEALNIPAVHLYDLYVPMAPEFKSSFSYDEAYDILVNTVGVLGEDYQSVVREAKDAGWIDVYETPGKTSGAYSNGAAYGVHPYILLNYRPELEGVLTLAHEMGHSMHSYFSNHTQPFSKCDYTIFVAEVASTCNEVLTIQSLRERYAGDPAAQLVLIERLLEGFRTTVFRQTLFAEFEMKAHEMEEAGEPLTCDSLRKMYTDLYRTYYGGACKIDSLIENEWMRIPHFYNSFYVYKYATGFCAAVALAKRIREEGAPAVKDYRRFLTLGGSMSPIEELKIAGVDMSTVQPVSAALDTFAELVADFSAMLSAYHA